MKNYRIIDVVRCFFKDKKTGNMIPYFKCIAVHVLPTTDFDNPEQFGSRDGWANMNLEIFKCSADIVKDCRLNQNAVVTILFDSFGRIAQITKV